MLSSQDRYSRQKRLKEVGLEGQLRIEACALVLSPGPEAPIALEYLRRAGALGVQVRADASPAKPFPHGTCFHSELARSYAAGAWTALTGVLEALSEPSA